MSQSPNDYNKYQMFYHHDLWYVVGYLVGIAVLGFGISNIVPLKFFQFLFMSWLVLPVIYGLFTMFTRRVGINLRGRRRQDAEDLAAYRARPKRIFNYETGKVEEK